MSTYGPPDDYGQGYPPPGGQGYPPPGGQGYPPQGGQGYPPQGGQGYPPQGGQGYPGDNYPVSGYPGDNYPVSGSQGYPPQSGYPQAPGYPADPYNQPAPGFPPGPGYPAAVPPKKRGNTGLIITLSVVGVPLKNCCGGGFYAYAQVKGAVDTASSSYPTIDPTQSTTSSTKDAANAKVGDCVKKSPAPGFPDQMAIAPCTESGTYTVKARFDGTASQAKCDNVSEFNYYEDYPTDSKDFVLCIDEN